MLARQRKYDLCHDALICLTPLENCDINILVMITKFRTALYAMASLSLACIPALSLSSCGGSDSEEDLSYTIPVFPETTEALVGYELRGAIVMTHSPTGIYEEDVELIEFVSASLVNITFANDVVAQTAYTYTYNDKDSVTLVIDVPADQQVGGTDNGDTYVLTLTQPSTYYQVVLKNDSVYRAATGTSYPLFALNGSLNFLNPNQ